MKDELLHLTNVKGEFIAKTLANKVYKRFGIHVRWTDTSTPSTYTVDLIDNGDIGPSRFNYISGYAVGVLEILETVYRD